MSEIVAGIIISALGGSVLTSLGFMVAFSYRFARIETTLTSFCKKVDAHIDKEQTIHDLHFQLSNDVSRQDERLKTLEAKQ